MPDPAGNHVDHHSVATTDTDLTNQLVYNAVNNGTHCPASKHVSLASFLLCCSLFMLFRLNVPGRIVF